MAKRWIRKWAHDRATDGWSPIPTRVVSNEEYAPLPQTREQAHVAALVRETARQNARALGVSRRAFLASGPGLAAALLAMNQVFGDVFDVEAVEAYEPAAFQERSPRAPFIFDIQTHHVAAPAMGPISALQPNPLALLELRRRASRWNPALRNRRPRVEDLYLETFIKEVFLDSDTTVAVLSGIPSATDATNILPPYRMAETRAIVNKLAASRRLLAHGLVAPNKGSSDLETMRRQASELKLDAWKGYTGLPLGDPPAAWRVDDEKVGYPMLEEARRLGVRNICLHKGLPFAGTNEADWHPGDLARAAREFPDLNFIVYHAGFRSLAAALPATRDEFVRISRVDWVTDLCEMRAKDPKLTNVYAELGSTFAMTVITAPLLCGHILGMLVKHLGADHVLWGTDAIWWGSPRWQLEAFRRFRIPRPIADRFGYAPLTGDVKRQILGLNAAKLYGVDPAAAVHPVPNDFVSKLKAAYLDEGPSPSLTQYGWIIGS
ncbi:MAG: amidohydrolase family protein [Candidatus Rokubacteria bacterium]|nr:amidohydrolase family protein [Candidatus Rokubacteria bacterium]